MSINARVRAHEHGHEKGVHWGFGGAVAIGEGGTAWGPGVNG